MNFSILIKPHILNVLFKLKGRWGVGGKINQRTYIHNLWTQIKQCGESCLFVFFGGGGLKAIKMYLSNIIFSRKLTIPEIYSKQI